nr:MAG TPA: hypothetical protein [Caudoviricetes sp.]
MLARTIVIIILAILSCHVETVVLMSKVNK